MSADLQDLRRQFEQAYGKEFTEFLLLDHMDPPWLCPHCKTETVRKLWLGEPNTRMGDSVWGKWYLWCDRCLTGIYCPFGTYAVPHGIPYIRWGDEEALKKSLPASLRLIRPESELNVKR